MQSKFVFHKPPEHFNPTTEVSACFLTVGEEVLFLKRLSHMVEGDTWGIPGGKCEQGETAQEAVIREVYEETGIILPAEYIKRHGKVYIRYPHVDFVYHMFGFPMQDFPDVIINPNEHATYQWITLKAAPHSRRR